MSNEKPTPTKEQEEIIAAVLRGESIIVKALAGAAKTSTIEMASAALAAETKGDVPGLALAFNKKIAEELTPRLPFPVKTLNALGHAAWARKTGVRLNLQSDKMTGLKKALGFDALPWELVRLVALAKLNGLVPTGWKHLAKTSILQDVEESWAGLAEDLDLSLQWENPLTGKTTDLLGPARALLAKSIESAFGGTIDFDDQVYMSTIFGGKGTFPSPQILFVDEAQDLSPLNHAMLKAIAPKQLVVVGDPLQSIYAFRGADVNSMEKLEKDWGLKSHVLSVCFRCSTEVARLAQEWAPHMQSPEWAKKGKVTELPEGTAADREDLTWNFSALPTEVTVLCRNNAPLIKLALKIFRTKRIAFLGNKGGAQMLSALRQIVKYKGKKMSIEEVAQAIDRWRSAEILASSPTKHETIMDKAEALLHCAEAAETYEGLERVIEDLFEAKSANILFGTGHGAKGLEWKNVLHLDSWRLPSKFATSPSALQQEENLAYVITTRAKENLFFANLDDFRKESV